MMKQTELNIGNLNNPWQVDPSYYQTSINYADTVKAPEDKPNRFDLEQQIFDAWHVTDDLDVLFEAVMESDLTKDQISNVLLGMKELYHLKFERLFDTFEKMIQSGKM